MRIVHLAYAYGNSGGAAIALTRLHRALLRSGEDSHVVCVVDKSKGRDDGIHVVPNIGSFKRWIYFQLAHLLRGMWKFTPLQRSCELCLLSSGAEKTVNGLKPDVVNIHWINAGVETFKKLSRIKAPIVVTMHDCWMVNGFDPYPFGDRRYLNGFKRADSSLLERVLVAWKRNFIESKNVAFSCPSNWMCSVVSESLVGRGKRCRRVYNCMDEVYLSGKVAAGNKDKFRVLFGGDNASMNKTKGFDLLVESLRILSEIVRNRVELILFGGEVGDLGVSGIKVRSVGRVGSAGELKDLYCSCDALALPSRADNAPQIKYEALCSGLPVVTFSVTGCPEDIIAGKNGYVARFPDCQDFANCLLLAYGDWADGRVNHLGIASEMRTKMSTKTIVSAMRGYYAEICC